MAIRITQDGDNCFTIDAHHNIGIFFDRELLTWLYENTSGNILFSSITDQTSLFVEFETEEDAMAFKLRWL